jgi:hypothetical protein
VGDSNRDSDAVCLEIINGVRSTGERTHFDWFYRIADNLESRIAENVRLRELFLRIRKDAEGELVQGQGMVYDGFRDGYLRYARDILEAIKEVEGIIPTE